MRAFLAIEIENYLKEDIIKTQNIIDNTNSAKIKYVEENNLHLTLKFFGDINPRKEKQINKIIEKTINDYSEYTLKFNKVGAFPNIKHPRVIWIGATDKKNNTINLIKQLDEQFSKIGFKKERDYVPHLTIGRVKNVYDNDLLTQKLTELKKHYTGKMKVKSIQLKSSQLTPDGPIYSTEKEYKL